LECSERLCLETVSRSLSEHSALLMNRKDCVLSNGAVLSLLRLVRFFPLELRLSQSHSCFVAYATVESQLGQQVQLLADGQRRFGGSRFVGTTQLVGAGAGEAALLVCGEVDMVRFQVIIDYNDAVFLEILLDTLFLHHPDQFGRREVFPAPQQVLKDKLGQGQRGRSVAGY
jgi:hypothetical protein